MNKYDKYILAYISESGFATGKELNKKLQEEFSISSENARKIIQRAASSSFIHSTDPVSFGNGQFVYMPKGKYLDKEMILKITKEHRPPLYRIISLMDLNEGIISYYEALKVSGSPLDGKKTKTDTLDKLAKELEILRLATIVSDGKGVNYLINPNAVDMADIYTSQHYARMKTDAMFIPDIIKSLIGFNIIDNIQVLYRNKTAPSIGAIQNNFVWDAVAYTKTTGINSNKASQANTIDKQTMVLMDIVIHRKYTDHDFQGFFSRVQSVLNSVKNGQRKVLPIVIFAETETKKTYNTIHKLGFLSFDLASVYGSKIYDVIKSLNNLKLEESLTNENASDISKIVEETLATIKNTGQEDNLKNIKGDLFEFLIYPFLARTFPNCSIQHGKKLSTPTNKREGFEYDFIIHCPDFNEYVVIELKGYLSTARISLGTIEKKNTVSWFYGKTFPFAQKILNTQLNHPKVTGCFITSAGFQDDAITYMEKLNTGKIKPSQLDTWYDGEKLMRSLETKGLEKVKAIIKRYYVKEEI